MTEEIIRTLAEKVMGYKDWDGWWWHPDTAFVAKSAEWNPLKNDIHCGAVIDAMVAKGFLIVLQRFVDFGGEKRWNCSFLPSNAERTLGSDRRRVVCEAALKAIEASVPT